MNGRTLLICVVGVAAIVSRFYLHSSGIISETSRIARRVYLHEAALNIAETGVKAGIRKIGDEPLWRDKTPLMDILGGKASISARDTTYHGKPCIRVRCTGIMMYGTPEEQTEVATAYLFGDAMPPVVRGAITTTHDYVQGAGFIVDGRDHDMEGNLTGEAGADAIWTARSCSPDCKCREGKAARGEAGLLTGGIVARHMKSAGRFPSSPDSVLRSCGARIEEGTLKAIALSGTGGSQYVTDASMLELPLKGVTYVELPPGGRWTGASISGSGVLVIHNGTHDACLQNAGGGTFTGIVLCDEVVHLDFTVVGAVVSMGCRDDDIGGGKGRVLFCSEAVKSCTGQVARGMCARESLMGLLAWN